MLNRIICFTVVLSVLISVLSFDAGAVNFSVSAQSAVLINADTLEIVYEKNAHEKRGMASTTKIMTSILALEYGNENKSINVRDEDVKVEGTSIGLKAGDKVTLDVLVAGMLLESGNDAANVTATAVSGSKKAFADLMNKKAEEIGMKNTSFKNPSGLTEEGHFSTAYDMALLASYAVRNEKFRKLCSCKSMRVSYGEEEIERTFYNHNKLLSMVDGVFGIKTGFTKASGRCLVSAAEREGVTLIAVTLFAPDDWNDHKKLFEYGFDEVKIKTARFDEKTVKIPVVGSEKRYINVYLSDEMEIPSSEETIKSVDFRVYCEPFVYAGVEKGELVGCVEAVNSQGAVISKSFLLAEESAPLNFKEKTEPPTIWEKLKKFTEGLSF